MHPVFEKFLRHGRFTGKQTRGNGGKKRKKRKKRGKKEWNKRVKRDGKGQTDVKRNRTIVNPDVLSCQDVVSGADMTQMESRALTTNNREKYRTPSPPPRLYALYALKQITLESSTRRRPIKSFDLAFVRRRVVAKLSPIYTTRPPRFTSLGKRSAAQLSPNNRKLIRAPLLLTSVKKNFQITTRASNTIMILQNGMERLKNLSLDRYSPRDAINVRSQKIERKKLAILSHYSFRSNRMSIILGSTFVEIRRDYEN